MSIKKMTIMDAAEHFGVSKEAIHNRIRRGSLQTEMQGDVKMVLLDASKKVAQTPRRTNTPRAAVSSDRYYKLLEEQNAKLQARVEVLEGETRSLRDQKELMLIEERKKIEQIYKEKDEQLKNILGTLASQFMLDIPKTQEVIIESVEAEIEVEEVVVEESLEIISDEVPELESLKSSQENVVSLKKYVASLELPEELAKKLTKKIRKKAEVDRRLITIGSKIYLNLSRYDYSDFVKKQK
jgi:hypothetical protein